MTEQKEKRPDFFQTELSRNMRELLKEKGMEDPSNREPFDVNLKSMGGKGEDKVGGINEARVEFPQDVDQMKNDFMVRIVLSEKDQPDTDVKIRLIEEGEVGPNPVEVWRGEFEITLSGTVERYVRSANVIVRTEIEETRREKKK